MRRQLELIEDGQLQLLTVPEAAGLLRVGRACVYQLIARGELKSTKVGRLRRIPRRAVLEYLAAGLEGER